MKIGEVLGKIPLESLGSKVGLYLSYEEEKGWDVVHLNWIQRLFRYFGCCFRSTSLTHIAEKLSKEEIPYPLRLKIQECFDRTYPKGDNPLKPLTFALPAKI